MGTMQRHDPEHPCPICKGHSRMPSGQGVRCAGFTADAYVRCTREQFAGRLQLDENTVPPTYRHWTGPGTCKCRKSHPGNERRYGR